MNVYFFNLIGLTTIFSLINGELYNVAFHYYSKERNVTRNAQYSECEEKELGENIQGMLKRVAFVNLEDDDGDEGEELHEDCLESLAELTLALKGEEINEETLEREKENLYYEIVRKHGEFYQEYCLGLTSAAAKLEAEAILDANTQLCQNSEDCNENTFIKYKAAEVLWNVSYEYRKKEGQDDYHTTITQKIYALQVSPYMKGEIPGLPARTKRQANCCQQNCDNLCCITIFWGTVQICIPGCKLICYTCQLLNGCLNLWCHAVGQVGRVLLPHFAGLMSLTQLTNGPPIFPVNQRELLRGCYGDLVDNVRVWWGVNVVGFWALATTLGFDVYIAQPIAPLPPLALLHHEMEHVRQFVSVGNSLSNFGYEYFRQWCEGGFTWAGIQWEQEAIAVENVACPVFFTEDDLFDGLLVHIVAFNGEFISAPNGDNRVIRTSLNTGNAETFTVRVQGGRFGFETNHANPNRIRARRRRARTETDNLNNQQLFTLQEDPNDNTRFTLESSFNNRFLRINWLGRLDNKRNTNNRSFFRFRNV